jgi:hypothetical protein
MNSLEDAYVNMAKAEEKLFNNNNDDKTEFDDNTSIKEDF